MQFSLPVWRRFGSLGSVVVTGMASAVLPGSVADQEELARPGIDFPTIPLSLTFAENVTSGLFRITLPDNSISSSIKVFQFFLASVTPISSSSGLPLAQSPRLSSVNTTATITIIDDEGGAGQFQLSPTSATTSEGSNLAFDILRLGGTSGRVSVLVQTLDSGAASSTEDYQPFREEIVFMTGVSQMSFSVRILDDTIAEGPEDFSISLSIPSANVLVDTNAVS